MHEQAMALERERILADLHDGLGASLIGLLRHVQSGQADRTSVERCVLDALRQMRIALDALWLNGHRADTVSGDLRCRINETICSSAMHLQPKMRAAPPAGRLEIPSELTAREIEVLRALSRGYTYAEIGLRLGVSLGTVTSHIKNSYRKLTVHSAAAAVTRAAELGLLPSSGDRRPV